MSPYVWATLAAFVLTAWFVSWRFRGLMDALVEMTTEDADDFSGLVEELRQRDAP